MTIDDPKLAQVLEKADKLDVTLAVELASYMKQEIQKLEAHVADQVRTAVNANAQTVKRFDEMEAAFKNLKLDLEQTRMNRANMELREAEARYKIALDHKDGLSTQEKIEVKKTLEDQLTDRERVRAEQRRTWWREKILPGVTTALIISIVAPVGLALFIAILIFVLRALGLEVQFP
jgi:hypothetical protein